VFDFSQRTNLSTVDRGYPVSSGFLSSLASSRFDHDVSSSTRHFLVIFFFFFL
jgi:hypothetical protein